MITGMQSRRRSRMIRVDHWRADLLRRINEVERSIEERDARAAIVALSRLQTRIKILLECVEGD